MTRTTNRPKVNNDHIKLYLEQFLDIPGRRLLLQGYVCDDMFSTILIALDILESKGKGPITIRLNSEGGYVYDGNGIYDRIRQSPCKIIIECYGSCMSMATVVLQAADVRRVSEHCVCMIHHGSTFMSGDHQSTQNWAKHHKRDSDRCTDMYLARIREKHPRFTRRKLDQMLGHDVIMFAQEFVDLGLADEVF